MQDKQSGFEERIETINQIWNRESRWLWVVPGLLVGFIIGLLVGTGITVNDFIADFWPEALGLALTVLILDRVNEYRANRREYIRLYESIKSPVRDIAVDAIRVLKNRGEFEQALKDLSKNGPHPKLNWAGARLKGNHFEHLHTPAINLTGADISDTRWSYCDLSYSWLKSQNSSNILFFQTNLQYSIFSAFILTIPSSIKRRNGRFGEREWH